MDFIEGKTLEEHLKSATGSCLPLYEALDIGIQICTVLDFLHMTAELGISIERALMLDQSGLPLGLQAEGFLANLFAAQAVFLLRRDAPQP